MILAALLLLALQMDVSVQAGYDHFYNLEYPQAIASFQKALQAAPLDPNRHNHVAQAILFQLMFRAGALETEMVTGGNPFIRRPKMEPSAEDERIFKTAIAESVRLTQRSLSRNPNDAAALYAQGVAIGLRGTYNYLVRKAWLDSLRDVTAARRLHNRVVEIDPSNIDARMMQGVHDYIVGSLPWTYRMLGFLAGFTGDMEQGIKTVRLVAEKGDVNKVDAQILLGIVARRERRPADGVVLCQNLLTQFPRNFLFLFELSQMYADLGDQFSAMKTLDRVEELKKTSAPGFQALPAERIEFARGNLLFWYDDPDAAIPHLRRATANAHLLDPNAGVTAWLRLGQCLDLKGRRMEARTAYQAAIRYSPSSEEAKTARRHLSKPFTAQEKIDISI